MKAENVLVEILVKVRDMATEALEQLTPEEIKEKPVVNESNFFLTYKNYESPKLGKFQAADLKDNVPDRFQRVVNILKQNDAKIDNRYHGEGYNFSYWLYGDPVRIYRQQLKK